MTVITFANVITRYVFNFNILWALEVTVFLFAWLVILGASYALKKSAHLGVDVLINAVTAATRRLIGLVAGAAVVAFSLLMFKGAWDFWANFAELPQTEGRWFPLGFEDSFRGKGWYETTSTPIPDFMRVLEAWFNAGEPYEKMPRVIPYLVLPLGMGLLLLRSLQALWRIWCGDIDRLIAGHEAEDEVENAANAIEGEK
ncbi:MAG: TRAP transporter small permease [Roseibium sp.]|nr:TRAP transporter small permease [Roseibium sp.]